MNSKRRLVPFRGDISLWIIVSLMLVVSLIVIFSATVSMAHKEVRGDTSYYMIRQAKFILISFITMFFVHWVDFKVYAKYTRTIFYLSVILVIAAMFLGESRNEATRWIPVPFFGRFQPSEMLKVALMTLLAVQLGKRSAIIANIPILPSLSVSGWKRQPQKNRDIFNLTTKPLVMPVVIACVVIFPMNLSTAMMLFMVSMLVYFVARVRVREIIKLMAIGGLALTMIVSTMIVFKVGRAEMWLTRIENYVAPIAGKERKTNAKDKAENFQKEQAQIAVAAGGFFGKGPGQSTQRSQLPHPYSDFAYAFIIEEYGILGAVGIFWLYTMIFYRSAVIMRRCRSTTNALLVLGLSLSITVQALVNMLVCVGLFPVTGQPLPMISMGGSSVLFTCIALGIILSVSRQNQEEDLAEAKLLAQGQSATEDIDPEVDYAQESDDDEYNEEEYSGEHDKKSPLEKQQDDPDDFPFTIIDRQDSTKITDSKQKENVDLY